MISRMRKYACSVATITTELVRSSADLRHVLVPTAGALALGLRSPRPPLRAHWPP